MWSGNAEFHSILCRFSRFVDGEEDHILDSEIDLHEASMTSLNDEFEELIKNNDVTDDDDSINSMISEDSTDDVIGDEVKTAIMKSNGIGNKYNGKKRK